MPQLEIGELSYPFAAIVDVVLPDFAFNPVRRLCDSLCPVG
jgi:hypothetical protein